MKDKIDNIISMAMEFEKVSTIDPEGSNSALLYNELDTAAKSLDKEIDLRDDIRLLIKDIRDAIKGQSSLF